MCQRKSFTHGDFFQSIGQRLIRGDPDIGGSAWRQRYFHQIEREQVTHHGQREMPRRPGMLNHRQLELAAFHQSAVFAELFHHLRGQVSALQEGDR